MLVFKFSEMNGTYFNVSIIGVTIQNSEKKTSEVLYMWRLQLKHHVGALKSGPTASLQFV